MIYLDHNATTPVSKEVLDEMTPFFQDRFGNAASRTHQFGWDADKAVKQSRNRVASIINAKADEIIFNSGATEGINFVIKGVFENYSDKGNHIITVKTEHTAVLDVCKYLETKGAEVTYLDVDQDGLINLEDLQNAIKETTILISVMYANNETGVIQDIAQIGQVARDKDILFFCDATQAVGKIPVDVVQDNIDILTISSHKIYGPKGVGGVYVNRRYPKINLGALIHGGGHEKGYRSGTLNVAGIVGFGKACELAKDNLSSYTTSCLELRNQLEQGLLEIEGTEINGHKEKRLPNTINIYFKGVDAEALIMKVRDKIAISSGSACTSADVLPSHVLIAMCNSEERAFQSVRISISCQNLDVNDICGFFIDSIQNFRLLS